MREEKKLKLNGLLTLVLPGHLGYYGNMLLAAKRSVNFYEK